MKRHFISIIFALLAVVTHTSQLVELAPTRQNYYGSLIGKLNRRDHNVSGEVYAVDEQTLFIRNFNYDGLAPDAYFWSSVISPQPAATDGFIVPDEKGSTKPLERYLEKDIVLRLPEGKTLREINWLSIWSRPKKENSGEIMIGPNLITPRPLEIAPLSQLAHGVKSGPITIVDAQTFLVTDFHYDGLGPAAYFWLTRGSMGLSSNGLRLKDENGSANLLRKYTGETVVISLPDELTIYDFDFFGVWCKEFQVNFGQTRIPQTAKVPPSPKMLGIKPENKLNCEILYDDLGYEIRWVLDGDDIVMQLVGKIEPGEYMAFGLGKDDSKSDMNNADAVVTWVDRNSGQVHAVDYFLGAKQQCNANNPDKQGSCPDTKLVGGGDSLTLLHGAIVNGYSMVTFKRPQLGVDELYDQHVYSDGQQSVLWAIGTLNAQKEIGYHRLKTRSNMFIDFARNPQWNCPVPDLNASMHNSLPITSASQLDQTVVSAMSIPSSLESNYPSNTNEQAQHLKHESMSEGSNVSTRHSSANENQLRHNNIADVARSAQKVKVAESHHHHPTESHSGQPISNRSADHNDPWFIPSIVCPSDRIFYAQIGPTAAHKGYEGLTGRTSWGVSWYINGLMIPELVMERGQTYRFVVEGGNDKTSVNRRHPFYLTDSPEGGFHFKTDDERLKERIFAGVALRGDGQFVPTSEGRLCEWKQTNQTLANPDLYPTFSTYQRSLKLDCVAGQASMLKFMPDSNTPDVIYYQCYTHSYMGWRIRVVDSCNSYLAALNSTIGQRSFSNNNVKRDVKKPRSLVTSSDDDDDDYIDDDETPDDKNNQRNTYNRRHSLVLSANEPIMNNHIIQGNQFVAEDFGGDAHSFSTEMSTVPNEDMLILNTSQLLQRQSLNLSSIEDLLKLPHADLEFIDQSSQSEGASLEPHYIHSGPSFSSNPLPLNNFTTATQINNKTIAKSPKTLHSYMRRLASIYYPVQQQLASMLASPSSQTSSSAQLPFVSPSSSNSLAQMQSTHLTSTDPTKSHSQISTFSLSNLVSKPKIDLSKSSISKKLNKLRFKSGRKYEPVQVAKPPTPANEFNYDIFNNQIAQLEKQQQQFQSLEMASSWPQQLPTEQLFNYLPMIAASSDEQQQAIDSMSNLQSSQIILANMLGQPTAFSNENINSMKPLRQSSNNARQRVHPVQAHTDIDGLRQPMRHSEIPLGLSNYLGQQPYVIDYLSMIVNNRTTDEPYSTAPSQKIKYSHVPTWINPTAHPNQPTKLLRTRPIHQPQPSVYITRLSQQNSYPFNLKPPPQPIPQQDGKFWPDSPSTIGNGAGSNSAHYPNIQPYAASIQNQPAQQLTSGSPVNIYKDSGYRNQISNIPSMALTIHDAHPNGNTNGFQSGRVPNKQVELDSLSGSGSGSYYDFRQQPALIVSGSQQQPAKNSEQADSSSSGAGGQHHHHHHHQQQQQQLQPQPQSDGDLDHMIAMERFSKQSSDGRPPSIVHPVTGEPVHFGDDKIMSTLSEDQSQQGGPAQQQAPSNFSFGRDHPLDGSDLPRRFSAMLIDKNMVGSSDSSTTPTSQANYIQRINVSDFSTQPTSAMQLEGSGGSENSDKIQRTGTFSSNSTLQQVDECGTLEKAQCHRMGTTESAVSAVLVKPNSFDFFPDSLTSTTTTSSASPLTPSFGPPIMSTSNLSSISSSRDNAGAIDDGLIFKSTLTEPITSTLIHSPSVGLGPFNGNHFVSQLNFDSSPFIPIEVKNPLYYTNQQQVAASNLLTSRLKPSSLIESMLNQHQNLLRPEPPVQVASYLAQHLVNHNPMFVSSEKSVASNQPMALSISISSSANNGQHATLTNSNNTRAASSSDLIILKPAILTKQTPQTYSLKPEYLTNQFKFINDNSLSNTSDQDLYLSNEIGGESSRRIAGNQFDRLSSLSSPPSTSIALDPIQAANTISSNIRHTNATSVNGLAESINTGLITQLAFERQTDDQNYSTTHVLHPKNIALQSKENYSTKIEATRGTDKLAQHRQTYIPSKPIPLNYEPSSSSNTDGVRLNPRGDNINTVYRDNNTDNAILSHVMSLISSNAIPTPPLIPVASYSSADYFLPIGDRSLRSIRG